MNDPNKIGLKLYRDWKKRNTDSTYIDELPDEISQIEKPKTKRLYILFFYALQGSSQKKTLERLRQLESLQTENIKNFSPDNWTEDTLGLDLKVIAKAQVKEIKDSLKIKQTLSSTIRDLARFSLTNSEIPQSPIELLNFPGLTKYKVNLIMVNAWLFPYEIPTLPAVIRVLYRRGWLKAKSIQRLKESLRGIKESEISRKTQNIFSFPIRREITTGLIDHGINICKEKSPLCSKCIISKGCPSSRSGREFITYLDTLQQEGHFIKEKPRKKESNKELESFTTEEEEDMSDI